MSSSLDDLIGGTKPQAAPGSLDALIAGGPSPARMQVGPKKKIGQMLEEGVTEAQKTFPQAIIAAPMSIPFVGKLASKFIAKPIAAAFERVAPLQKANLEKGLELAGNAYHQMLTHQEELLRKVGVPSLADKLALARQNGQLIAGKYSAQYSKAFASLSKEERILATDVTEGTRTVADLVGKVDPGRETVVAKAGEELRRINKEFGTMLRDKGVPVENAEGEVRRGYFLNENYFPHVNVDTEKFIVPGKVQDEAVQTLLQKNVVKSKEEALDWLLNHHKFSTAEELAKGPGSFRNSHLKARTIGLPGYEKDPHLVMPGYFEQMGRRISLADMFGMKEMIGESGEKALMQPGISSFGPKELYPAAFAEVELLAKGTTQREMADNVLEDYFGKAYKPGWTMREVGSRAMQWQVLTKLPLSFINQTSQVLGGVVRTHYSGAVKDLIRAARSNPEDMYFIRRSGAVLHDAVRKSQAELYGNGDVVEKRLRQTFFTWTDNLARKFGALRGMSFAEDQAKQIVKAVPGSTHFNRLATRLSGLGLDPSAIIKQGGQLTDDEMSRAAHTVAFDVNFHGDALSLSGFLRDPKYKLLTQFKSFVQQNAIFTKNHVVKPAMLYAQSGGKRGDIAPMMRWLALSGAGGEAIAEFKSFITNRQRPADIRERLLEDFAAGSGFGLVSDAFYLMHQDAKGIGAYALGGPTMGAGSKAAEALKDLPQGKPAHAARFMLREIAPIIHPTVAMAAPAVENAIFPNKKRPPLVGNQP